jgi:hypothetical protein
MRTTRFRPAPAAAAFALAALGAIAALGPTPGLADTVHLKTGEVLEGKVEDRGAAGVVVETPFGSIAVPRDEIARIERGATRDDRYAAERARTRLDDPEEVERLARWCRANEMEGEARRLEAEARRQRLAAKRAALAPGDAEGLYALAAWAEGAGYGREVVDGFLREALLASPEHARARVALERGKAQADAEAARAEAAAARAEAARIVEEAKAEWREADRERVAAARLRAELEGRVAAAKAYEAQAQDAARAAEAELAAARRDRAAAEALRLEWERRLAQGCPRCGQH